MLVSIIIITLNEADYLVETLKSIEKASIMKNNKQLPIEIIISDGRSTDDTLRIAKKFTDKIITGKRGRANQLNKGVTLAKGNLFLFLHADTKLSRGTLLRVYHKMRKPRYIAGGFKKQWDWNNKIKDRSILKIANFLWERMGNWLVKFTKLFPGDNGIFVRKTVFNKLSGFRDFWICEDLDFTKRIKQKFGKKKILYVREPVLTSSRRLRSFGFFKTIFIWTIIYILWRARMSPRKIKLFLHRHSFAYE